MILQVKMTRIVKVEFKSMELHDNVCKRCPVTLKLVLPIAGQPGTLMAATTGPP